MKTLALAASLLLSIGNLHAAGDPASAAATITVEVQGAVRKPQKLTLPKGSKLTKALAFCGGLTSTADARDTSIISVPTGGGSSNIVKVVDIYAITLRKTAPDVVLKDGDLVKVPGHAPAVPGPR